MMSDLTPAQKATELQITASNPAHNAWVSASAGSGKTKVLVQRVLRLLLNGTKPETILAITYTKAAAAEMQNRITRDLSNWAVVVDTELRKNLGAVLGTTPTDTHMQTARQLFAQVLDTPGGIKIQTIHSFCQSLLAQFPLESGVPVGFKVLENADSIIDKVFAQLAQNPDTIPHLQRLMQYGTTDNFHSTIKTVLSQRHHFYKVFTADFDVYSVLGIRSSDTVEMYRQHLVDDFTKCLPAVTEFKDNISGEIGKKTVEKFYNAMLSVLQTPLEYTRVQGFFDTVCKKDSTDFSLGATLILKQNADVLQPLSDIYQAYQDKCICLQMAQNTESLICVAQHFIRQYQQTKHTYNALDFDDIIAYTERLFAKVGVAEWVTYKTDKGHQHILLDESQDTSPEQWHILRSIIDPFFASPMQQTSEHPDHTVFAVGDDKQSIYGFQGADPQGFFDNKIHFKNLSDGMGYAFKDVPLAVSFRTVPAVLQWVDTTMAQAGMTHLGSGESITHEAHRTDAYGRIELLPVLYTQNNMIPKAPIAYAQEIAHKIQDILQQNTILPSTGRPAQAGDVLVLVKKRSGDFVNALIRTLNNIGVAVAGNDRLKLYENIAVQDILALLQFSILPEDDLTLASVLKSPLVGLTDADICAFAHHRGYKSLWQALRDMQHHADIVNYLQRFLKMADFARPFEIINTLLNSPCQLYGGGAEPLTGRQAFVARLGGAVHDVIDELLQLAMAYEKDTIPTVQGLLDKVKNDATEIKRDADSRHQNQVRIMTVHGAKGLESPIVIVPDCYRDDRDMEQLIWNETNTQIVVARDKLQRHMARQKLAISQDSIDKDLRESKRLLYVAMTRAEDMLICGGYGRSHKNWCWYKDLQQGMEQVQSGTEIDYQPYKNIGLWDSDGQKKKPYSTSAYVYEHNRQNKPVSVDTDWQNLHTDTDGVHIPDWAYTPAPSESPTARPLSPSDVLMTDTTPAPSPLALHKMAVNDIYKRGNIMHQALENISFVAPDNRSQILQRYLKTPSFQLDTATQQEYLQEILQVVETYPFIFADTARPEVPVSGIVAIDGVKTPVNGIIDRLCEREDSIWIIDFKSNRPPTESLDKVPDIYKQQLKIYGDLIAEIYPKKQIYTALLWTYNCRLLEIPR